MLKKLPIIIFIAILIMDVLPSCYDKDFTDISDSLHWQPSFSLPVGSTTFEVDNFFSTLNIVNELDSLIDIPDSLSGLPDSLMISTLDSLGLLDSIDLDSIYFNNKIQYLLQKKIPLNDNFDYSFGDVVEEYDNIDSVLFKIYVENGFPTKTDIQIYMLDSANNIVDSLFTTPSSEYFPPASINDNEKVIEPSIGTIDVPFDSARIDKLKITKNVLFNVDISTTNDKIQKVKFYSSYNIFIKLGMRLAFHKDISGASSAK